MKRLLITLILSLACLLVYAQKTTVNKYKIMKVELTDSSDVSEALENAYSQKVKQLQFWKADTLITYLNKGDITRIITETNKKDYSFSTFNKEQDRYRMVFPQRNYISEPKTYKEYETYVGRYKVRTAIFKDGTSIITTKKLY